MTPLEVSLTRIATTLNGLGRQFAVVGGFAVSALTQPRMTRDTDLVLTTTGDSDAEQLVYQLRDSGYDIQALVEHEATQRIATVRLAHENDLLVCDLLFASCGIEAEIVAGAHLLDVTDQVRLPVASVGHLIAMKLLARDDRNRPTDAADLDALAKIAQNEDWATAGKAVDLITERGYNRSRDLKAFLSQLREH